MTLGEGDFGGYRDLDYKGETRRFVAEVWVPGDDTTLEELDIDAEHHTHAHIIAQLALTRDYIVGMRVKKVRGPMTGLYL